MSQTPTIDMRKAPRWCSALNWVMTQEALLEDLPGGTSPLMKDQGDALKSLMMRTRSDPQSLLETLVSRRCHKVGPAFEALIQWGLETGLGYDCIAWDLQVRAGKRTIGALDLVLRDTDGRIEHWELAYKLYLQADEGHGWASWVGPNERDRLSLKVAKMVDHQLPLSSRPEAVQVLEQRGVKNVDMRRILLLGTLFKHWASAPTRALQATQLAQGEWARASELKGIVERYPEARWSRREKPFWFGPWEPHGDSVSSIQLRDVLNEFNVTRPQLWTCSDGGGKPFFFVSERWGRTS